ncbi:Mu transposase C-terminal domain-containing protein [Neisseria shayeganii]|uniref:Transposase n=1 Tax=Neisseria shayeganii TaxID=607712 RepID=A0A7D7N4P0_9NEIS|nr:Mu transposase C-terminal domain-containing protein [Neisseria shayeganii]QMT39960.1 transposase [Neisseria shayeganii]
MKTHYALSELVGMGLDLPKSVQGLGYKATKENWPYIETECQGGKGGKRKEYAPPPEVMKQIQEKKVADLLAASAPAPLPALADPVLPAVVAEMPATTEKQRLVDGARQGVLKAVEDVMQQSGVKMEQAIQTVLTQAQMPGFEHLARMFELARDERGASAGRLPTSRTVKRWFQRREETQSLVPKVKQASQAMPAWAGLFLHFYQQPQKPSVQAAYERFCMAHLAEEPLAKLPSVHQVRRFLDKLGNVSRQKGRMGSREIKNIKPYVVREFLHLAPTDIYTADGHTFDAEVLHPDSGKPFRPEITTIADVATRKIVGWSVDLAESGMAVLMALSHACESNGIGAVLYVDNGKGYKNAMMTDEATGLMGRLGMTMMHSLPYSSQARGVIERLHQTVWVEAAKSLQSYMGKDMDAEAKQQVHKTSRALVRQGVSLKGVPALANIQSLNPHLLPTWAEFEAFCNWHVERYNNRPHRSLPKILDVAGIKRHMTPNEMWALKVEEGAEIVPLKPEDKHLLFMPQVLRTVRRGMVHFRNNQYYSARLEEYHGDLVRVAYDIHCAEKVWIYDDCGRPVCTAEWNGNRVDYVPVSVVDQAKDKRVDAQLKLLGKRADTLESARPVRAITHQESSLNIGGMVLNMADLAQRGEEALAALQAGAETEAAALPAAEDAEAAWTPPATPEERLRLYEQMKDRPGLTGRAEVWVRRYPSSQEYRALSRRAAGG